METIKRTERGIEYLIGTLKEKRSIVTKAFFWKIPHKSTKQEDISLKLGRYRKKAMGQEALENEDPKSELTLDDEEFQNLLEFLWNNYEPFKKGFRKYIPVDGEFDERTIEDLKKIFGNPNKQKTFDLIARNNILPDDLVISLHDQTRRKAVIEFANMLDENLVEHRWQEWFKRNDWVLGSEFVELLDERIIDAANVSDYLMKAYDGFLDIVEIKRPQGHLRFWNGKKDHNNYVPSPDLVKAITQATKYIYEVEREANSIKFQDRVDGVKTVKPRCVLIFGRSNDWDGEQREAFRILNSSYHNLTIMTYDHVLERAKRILGMDGLDESTMYTPVVDTQPTTYSPPEELDDIPF